MELLQTRAACWCPILAMAAVAASRPQTKAAGRRYLISHPCLYLAGKMHGHWQVSFSALRPSFAEMCVTDMTARLSSILLS